MNTLEILGRRQNYAFLQKYKGLIVSCSGGLDSTALFHILYQELKEKINFPLALLHFNFGLRFDESEGDEAFVRKLAKDHGVEIIVRKVGTLERDNRKQKNIQSWARAIRLQTFKELADNGWAIAVAHQKDDLAENVLLRMIRGVSPGSLLGMQEWNAPYWRPLLTVTRAELAAWMQGHNLPNRSDSSNDKMIYSRNVIRKRVLPELEKLNSSAKDHLIRFAHETKEFVEFTRSSISAKLQQNDHSMSGINGELLEKLPKSVAYDVLSCGIGRPQERGINHNLLEQALTSIQRPSSSGTKTLMQLPSGRRLLRQKGELSISTDSGEAQKPRYRQHASAVLAEKRAIILGPSAIVDFFPLPAGTVLDQKFQVSNFESEPRTLKNF